jgi:CyaY protein
MLSARRVRLPRICHVMVEIVAIPLTPTNATLYPMTDQDFLNQAEALLLRLEQCCDQLNDSTDADIDSQRSGGMVTLTFANRSQIVVNLQKPLREVWLAARSGGYHFRFDGQLWQDTKGQGEFWQRLTRDASEQSGLVLTFS